MRILFLGGGGDMAVAMVHLMKHAGLVEPVGALHMHYAAMQNKACALTTLGKYYWRLVKEGKT